MEPAPIPPGGEKNFVGPVEKAWAIAYLATLLGVFGFMAVSLVAKSAPATCIAAGFMAVHLVARAACRAYDERQDPDKAKRRNFWSRLIVFVFFGPLLAVVLMILFAIAAAIKGESILPSLWQGPAVAGAGIAGVVVLDLFERGIVRLLFRRRSPNP